MRMVTARRAFVIPAVGGVYVHYDLDWDGRPVFWFREERPAPDAAAAPTYHLHQVIDGRAVALPLPPSTHVGMALYLHPDGWLVLTLGHNPVRQYPAPGVLNLRIATIYTRDGTFLRSFPLGAAVHPVIVAPDGKVWAGIPDEGQFYGSDEGLLCFDRSGQVVLKYNEDTAWRGEPSGGWPYDIYHCYALNVCSAEETWTYYYTNSNDFPLVQLVGLKLTEEWEAHPVKFAAAFAVSGRRALFARDFGRWQGLYLLSQDTGEVEKLQVVTEEGEPLPFPPPRPWDSDEHDYLGRGPLLYVRYPEAVYVIDMRELDTPRTSP